MTDVRHIPQSLQVADSKIPQLSNDRFLPHASQFIISTILLFHSPPPSAETKNGGVIPPFPHTSSWRDRLRYPGSQN
jgi:hypothetical protein